MTLTSFPESLRLWGEGGRVGERRGSGERRGKVRPMPTRDGSEKPRDGDKFGLRALLAAAIVGMVLAAVVVLIRAHSL